MFKNKLGKDYNQPVCLANESGVTYAASSDGAFALNASVAMTLQNALVDSYQIALRARIDYDSASRAAAGEKAFDNVISPVVKSMLESISKRLEVNFLYGQTGLGVPSTYTNTNATKTVLTISDASWAPGIWAGMKDATIDIVANETVINTTGALTISAVDIANKKITVTGASADITAIQNEITATGTGCDIYFYGSYGKEAPGIDKIITNTGTLFDIDAATYDLWKGNSIAIDAALTLAKLDDSIVTAVAMGLDENATVFISPKTWSKLMSDQAALRSYDASYSTKKSVNGFEVLEFHSQIGMLEVASHPYVKQGEGFIVPLSRVIRVGSTDVTFSNPANNMKFFIELQDYAGFELRCYSNQTIFSEAPSRMTKLTGITNS